MALRWALIGTGLHPDNKIAPALKLVPGAALAAVYSREQSRAEAFAQKHGVASPYSDLFYAEPPRREPKPRPVFPNDHGPVVDTTRESKRARRRRLAKAARALIQGEKP